MWEAICSLGIAATWRLAGGRLRFDYDEAMSTATLMTAEQFARMRTGEREDYELVDGELIPLPSGTPRHSKIRRRFERAIESYLEQNRQGEVLSETDCRLTDELVRRPDVSVFVGGRARQLDPDRVPIPFAPDIAIEVLSLSESAVDVTRKALTYLAAGCREVWVADHENGVVFVQTPMAVQRLRGDDRLESPLLPGFSHPVADLLVW
jgi:Uma2 family endonuclease